MKQNPHIMFHSTWKMLRNNYLGNHKLALPVAVFWFSIAMASVLAEDAFDPAKGFKPAQRDLTAIYLQLAESLKAYGTPLPYLRHMKQEHDRIRELYRAKLGKEASDQCPKGMDDAWLKDFSDNWDVMAPKLGLNAITKEIGQEMALAIKGTDGCGTIMIDIFHDRQRVVLDSFIKGHLPPRFSSFQEEILLKAGLANRKTAIDSMPPKQRAAVIPAAHIQDIINHLFQKLDRALKKEAAQDIKEIVLNTVRDTAVMADSELRAGIMEWALNAGSNEKTYSAESETQLNEAEKKVLVVLLRKKSFTKSDMSTVDKFYRDSYDKLTEQGKSEMDYRVWEGTRAR